jgi:hypothetical protein
MGAVVAVKQGSASSLYANIVSAKDLGFNSRTGIGALHTDGRIGHRELVAARRWFEDYAVAECGTRNTGPRHGNGGSSPSDAINHKALAVVRRQEAKNLIGDEIDRFLIMAVAGHTSPKEIAEGAGLDRKYVAGMIAASLKIMANYYELSDRAPN